MSALQFNIITMYQYLSDNQKKQIFGAFVGVLGVLTIFLAVKVINSIKEYSYIGRGVYAANVISVNGTADVFAVPDVATFSFSVTESAKDMATAQDLANKKSNTAIEAVKALGVADKDIKTISYNSYPKYEWKSGLCPQSVSSSGVEMSYPCSGKNVLTGYEVSQTLSVKVRKTQDAGTILAKVGSLNVENISGLNFVIDDMDKVQAEARDKAIQNAKDKAKVLSKSLGIKLDHIINFYENGNGGAYGGDMMYSAKGMGVSAQAVVADIQTGENKITANVTITFEVK